MVSGHGGSWGRVHLFLSLVDALAHTLDVWAAVCLPYTLPSTHFLPMNLNILSWLFTAPKIYPRKAYGGFEA